MNWVGGARSRLKYHGEKKAQKDFFERKRMAAKISKHVTMKMTPASRRSNLSQDLRAIQTVNKMHDPETKPYARRVQREIKNLDFDKLSKCRRSFDNADLGPMSPGTQPSSLALMDSADKHLDFNPFGQHNEDENRHIFKTPHLNKTPRLSPRYRSSSMVSYDAKVGKEEEFWDQVCLKDRSKAPSHPQVSSSFKHDRHAQDKVKNQKYLDFRNIFISEDCQMTPVWNLEPDIDPLIIHDYSTCYADKSTNRKVQCRQPKETYHENESKANYTKYFMETEDFINTPIKCVPTLHRRVEKDQMLPGDELRTSCRQSEHRMSSTFERQDCAPNHLAPCNWTPSPITLKHLPYKTDHSDSETLLQDTISLSNNISKPRKLQLINQHETENKTQSKSKPFHLESFRKFGLQKSLLNYRDIDLMKLDTIETEQMKVWEGDEELYGIKKCDNSMATHLHSTPKEDPSNEKEVKSAEKLRTNTVLRKSVSELLSEMKELEKDDDISGKEENVLEVTGQDPNTFNDEVDVYLMSCQEHVISEEKEEETKLTVQVMMKEMLRFVESTASSPMSQELSPMHFSPVGTSSVLDEPWIGGAAPRDPQQRKSSCGKATFDIETSTCIPDKPPMISTWVQTDSKTTLDMATSPHVHTKCMATQYSPQASWATHSPGYLPSTCTSPGAPLADMGSEVIIEDLGSCSGGVNSSMYSLRSRTQKGLK